MDKACTNIEKAREVGFSARHPLPQNWAGTETDGKDFDWDSIMLYNSEFGGKRRDDGSRAIVMTRKRDNAAFKGVSERDINDLINIYAPGPNSLQDLPFLGGSWKWSDALLALLSVCFRFFHVPCNHEADNLLFQFQGMRCPRVLGSVYRRWYLRFRLSYAWCLFMQVARRWMFVSDMYPYCYIQLLLHHFLVYLVEQDVRYCLSLTMDFYHFT